MWGQECCNGSKSCTGTGSAQGKALLPAEGWRLEAGQGQEPSPKGRLGAEHCLANHSSSDMMVTHGGEQSKANKTTTY